MAPLAVLLLAALAVADATHLVRFGYFSEAQPAVGVACARGWFDIPSLGVEVVCLPQSSGGYAVSRLDNDDLDVTFLGSTPMATALARGVDIESFFYGHGPGSSQGLVVDGRVIETPFDLVGKRIACPFGSTAHYQMAFIIDLLKTLTGGIGLAEPLKNLAGDALMAAWEAGEIDGAFCWGPVYNAMRADANMKVLLTAEQIAGWDKPTFIPLVYRRNLLTSNSVVGPAVVRHIAAVFAVLQSSWINFDAVWSETGPTSLLASVTHFTQNNVSAANNEVSHGAMSEFTFVSPAEQLSSCDYMGAAGCVATERGIAMDTKSTAEWQQYYKFIVQIKPTGRWWAYLRTDADVADHFSAAYNGSVLASALADIDAGAISLTSLLARGAAAWPATDGALGQDSTCGNASAGIVRLGPGAGGGATGSFGDGAGARAGRSYSDGLACQWEVAAASASDVVSLTFSAFRVWSGDVVTVTGADGALVAQLSGFNRTWPPLVALGGLRVSFFTDARSESAYNLPVGDGFVAHFDAAAAGCVDCGGRGECDASSGVCACDVGYGGADCSHAFCLGTQTHAASAAGTFASGVGALNATHVYPNDADCTFVVEVPSGFAAGYVRFTLSYDLEHAYDYVEVISGLTGHREAEVVTVPVADGAASLRFTSDNKGRRSGFVASYVALASAACTSDADCMSSAGATACDAATGACVCAAGWAGLACDSPKCLALNPWTISSGNAIASNASSAALPRNANCVWALNATADTAAATGLRIVFSTFQLEADSPGDAIVITRTVDGKVLQTMASTAESATPVTSIRNFTCDGASGACSLELSGETAVMMALTTDVNDDGATLSGVGATWYAVSACSDVASGSLDCELNGGSCSNGGCFAADGSANDCTCNWDMMCLPGMYFDVLQHECMSCAAGTYASGTGVRVSCDECAAGKFAPSEDSESCGSCANGQIALSRKSTECVVCPAGATCSTATSLTVNPGMWRGSFASFNIFDCPIRDACLGSNATTSLCAPGYGGILCAVCQPGFVKTSDGCVDCNTLSAPIVTMTTVSTTVVIVLAGWYLTRTSKRFAAALEAIQFSVAFKIYFATCQVLGVHATLLSDVLFEPLKGFLVNLAAATDLADFFGWFGVACAHHELRSFRTRLLIATIVPIVLISGVVASFVFRALFSPPNHMRALQHAHSTFALLLLYVALPSTSSMILRAFLRDSRPLGTHGEQYLIADYEVNTESTEYTHFLIPYAILCIVLYPVGINALYAVLLWKNRAVIRLEKNSAVGEKAKQKPTDGETMVSFLHLPFSVQYFWWEVVDSSRRVMLVAVPALIELPAARLVVASSISVVFLVIQTEYKPYATAEHNQLAALAGAQITGTLLFIVMQSAMTIPRVFGFLCIVLNIIILPLVVCFNARRLRRREDILNAFLVEHEVEEKMVGARKRGVGLKRQATGLAEFFDPSHFSEYWKAGQRSEYEVFCATLDWIDTALERPVSHGTWARILFTLEQLPLTSTANADVRHGLLLDTQNVSTTLMKKLELAFGFAQGERWFGFIVCDEQEHSERVRSGTFDGELVLVSKRPLPKYKVRVNSEIQEITLFDNRGGTETIPYTSTLWIAVKALAWKHDCALVNSMRDCREKEAQDSAKFSETCNLPSFGSSSAADTNMSYEALSLKNNFPEEMCGILDRDIFTRLLLHGATASAGYFRTTLTDLFSGANIQEGHSKLSSYDPKALTIAFAPVKGLGRTLVKFDEYALEGSKSQWPVTPQIRDTLRAKIEAPNGDLFADATNAIMSIFDVREGNGRLKNNLMAPKHQPPNLLINLVLRPPDRPPIMAEVQIFLREIEQLNEHRYYEIIRAPGPKELLDEGRDALEKFKVEEEEKSQEEQALEQPQKTPRRSSVRDTAWRTEWTSDAIRI